MGRARTKRKDLPERVYYSHGAYYYVHKLDNRWEKLDGDYAKAMAAWSKLIAAPTNIEKMGDLFDRYLLEVVPGKAPRTQKDNRQEMRFLRVFFGDMLVSCVTAVHVAAYRDNRVAKVRGNREIALLSHVFNYAIRWGYRTTNPCSVPGLRARERPRNRYATQAEIEAFKALCPTWLKAYLSLKNLIALRQQDMLVLEWDDIDDEGISVCPQKTENSTGKKIKIGLTKEVLDVLQSLPRASKLLFPTRLGTPYTSQGFGSIWRRVMTKFVSAGGVRFTEHDIRGGVATDMEDAAAAQKLLGHKNISMTEAYIKARKTDVVAPLTRKKK